MVFTQATLQANPDPTLRHPRRTPAASGAQPAHQRRSLPAPTLNLTARYSFAARRTPGRSGLPLPLPVPRSNLDAGPAVLVRRQAAGPQGRVVGVSLAALADATVDATGRCHPSHLSDARRSRRRTIRRRRDAAHA
jgi:hypothetical protein